MTSFDAAMKRISTTGTFLRKRVFPIMMLAAPALFVAVSFRLEMPPGQNRWPLIFIPGAVALVGFVLWKLLISDLVDEVYDLGEALLVRNKGTEVNIPLSNISKVTVSNFTNPVRVTVRLMVPCELGDKIVFEPLHKWAGFGSRGQKIVGDLERRCALRR